MNRRALRTWLCGVMAGCSDVVTDDRSAVSGVGNQPTFHLAMMTGDGDDAFQYNGFIPAALRSPLYGHEHDPLQMNDDGSYERRDVELGLQSPVSSMIGSASSGSLSDLQIGAGVTMADEETPQTPTSPYTFGRVAATFPIPSLSSEEEGLSLPDPYPPFSPMSDFDEVWAAPRVPFSVKSEGALPASAMAGHGQDPSVSESAKTESDEPMPTVSTDARDHVAPAESTGTPNTALPSATDAHVPGERQPQTVEGGSAQDLSPAVITTPVDAQSSTTQATGVSDRPLETECEFGPDPREGASHRKHIGLIPISNDYLISTVFWKGVDEAGVERNVRFIECRPSPSGRATAYVSVSDLTGANHTTIKTHPIGFLTRYATPSEFVMVPTRLRPSSIPKPAGRSHGRLMFALTKAGLERFLRSSIFADPELAVYHEFIRTRVMAQLEVLQLRENTSRETADLTLR